VVNGDSPTSRPPAGTPACSSTTLSLAPAPFLHRVRVTWNGPHGGTVASYTVLRSTGSTFSLQGLQTLAGTTYSSTDPTTEVTTYYTDDTEELPDSVSFTYIVKANFTDNGGGTGPASNEATIVARNDAPVAVANSYTMPQDGVLSRPAPELLANDTDTDSVGPILRVTADSPVTPPTHGSLVLNADGSFTYTPVKGYSGSDSFTYKAKDNRVWPLPPATGLYPMSPDSAPGLVSITITKAKK
jgi:hypothetical protein